MASSSVGGSSGAFIPVSEDQGMIDAVAKEVWRRGGRIPALEQSNGNRDDVSDEAA